MKLAVFHNVPAGGAKRALYCFTQELKRRGHAVDAYKTDAVSSDHFPLKEVSDHFFVYKFPPFNRVKNFRPYFLRSYVNFVHRAGYLNSVDTHYQKMAKEIDDRGYDLIFVHNCNFSQAPILLKHLKTKSVYYAHEPLRSIYEPYLEQIEYPLTTSMEKFKYSLIRPAHQMGKAHLKKIDRENILSADFVFTNSYYTRESLYKAYGILATVCYPGVDVNVFRPLNVPRKNYVLAVGSVSPIKKHDFVIEALSLMDQKIRPKFIIVGNMSPDDYVEKIKRMAAEKGVDLDIKLLISDNELLTLYNEARMVIYPPIMEPLGLVPLEAMACGTPVIGVKEGGIRETIVDGKTGILIERDPAACAEAIKKLLFDPALGQKMGEAGRAYVVEKWSWEKCTDRLEENFIKVLNGKLKNFSAPVP